MALILTALRRIGRGAFSNLFEAVLLRRPDILGRFSCHRHNLLTFKRKVGKVTPKGKLGEGGVWPEYIPPRQGDSRCSCPALNAMANHGIIPRDGTFALPTTLGQSILSLCAAVHCARPEPLLHLWHFDLADIDVHNGIEHDASLVRRDTFHQFHQGFPDGGLVAALLKSATGPPPKRDALPPSQAQLPPNESPYFNVAAHVSKATSDFDMNRTLTTADLSRLLSERRP
ncbi:Chloroperoxidase [Lactarius indigo]|nr:Chloroperoxidase [Lactarius indigo]